MSALPSATVSPMPSSARVPLVGLLRALMLAEAVTALVLAVFLSLLAGGTADFLGASVAAESETSLRFAAGAAFLFAIFAAVASRGARRRRAWAWTMAAILQVLLAIGTGVAVMTAEWHPAYLIGFAMAAVVMVVLSTGPVRRALGQD
jgi:hypothetical protein